MNNNIDPNIGKKTQFTSTNQPKNKGNKPSSLKKYFKANNLGALDKALLFENIIKKHTAKQLLKMVSTKEFPDGKEMSGLVWGFVVAWAADIKDVREIVANPGTGIILIRDGLDPNFLIHFFSFFFALGFANLPQSLRETVHSSPNLNPQGSIILFFQHLDDPVRSF